VAGANDQHDPVVYAAATAIRGVFLDVVETM